MKDGYYGAALQSPRNMLMSISVGEYWYNSSGITLFWGAVIDLKCPHSLATGLLGFSHFT